MQRRKKNETLKEFFSSLTLLPNPFKISPIASQQWSVWQCSTMARCSPNLNKLHIIEVMFAKTSFLKSSSHVEGVCTGLQRSTEI